MLCDDIARLGINDPSFDVESMKPMLARIANAVKFELAHDFAQAADALSVEYAQIVRALPFCRLPYHEVWIEVVATDRQNFIDGAKPTMLQRTPKRVGFLLTATDNKLDKWKAHLFWSINDMESGFTTHAASVAMKFDMGCGLSTLGADKTRLDSSDVWKAASPETRRTLASSCGIDLPDYVPAVWLRNHSRALDLWMSATMPDWAGEPQFLEATLALMNSPNATEKLYVDNTAFNRKRQTKDKPPLSSHHVLRIHPRQRVVMKATSQAERHGELRAHFVRAHWKVRGPGRIFFWRPFMRGRFKKGTITKDYKVT